MKYKIVKNIKIFFVFNLFLLIHFIVYLNILIIQDNRSRIIMYSVSFKKLLYNEIFFLKSIYILWMKNS
jgi:hypothetical protein